MTATPLLRISLSGYEIGTLALLPGDQNFFSFNEEYINDQQRPILSLSFKDAFGDLITTVKPTRTRLPAFFSNLLPEGQMRNYLAANARVKPQREFFLLWALGCDLPGAVRALPMDDVKLPMSLSSIDEGGQKQTKLEQMLRFSLAGVQLKFSAVMQARGGLTIPADGVGGSWILKLPDTKFKGVPENEFAMMELARCIGIKVPETMLVPLEKIAGLPSGIEQAGPSAFATKRFDRTEDGSPIHMEDFAQIFNVYPEKKYASATYRNIAEVIWSEIGEDGIVEFIRRLVFNILIGNGDMHLKNWSLIYPDRPPSGCTVELAPAYDFLSTIPYIKDDSMALKFVDTKAFESLSCDQLKRFAARASLPEKLVLATAIETVDLFVENWGNVSDFGLEKKIKKIVETHLKNIPLCNMLR